VLPINLTLTLTLTPTLTPTLIPTPTLTLSLTLILTKVQEEYILPALGIRNRHLRPVMHQPSEPWTLDPGPWTLALTLTLAR